MTCQHNWVPIEDLFENNCRIARAKCSICDMVGLNQLHLSAAISGEEVDGYGATSEYTEPSDRVYNGDIKTTDQREQDKRITPT